SGRALDPVGPSAPRGDRHRRIGERAVDRSAVSELEEYNTLTPPLPQFSPPAAPPPAPEVLVQLRGVSSATLATQLFKRGFRSRFMTGVLPLRPELKMVGLARTLRCIPAREDLDRLDVFRNPAMPQRL